MSVDGVRLPLGKKAAAHLEAACGGLNSSSHQYSHLSSILQPISSVGEHGLPQPLTEHGSPQQPLTRTLLKITRPHLPLPTPYFLEDEEYERPPLEFW
jgi:hypothetical protein